MDKLGKDILKWILIALCGITILPILISICTKLNNFRIIICIFIAISIFVFIKIYMKYVLHFVKPIRLKVTNKIRKSKIDKKFIELYNEIIKNCPTELEIYRKKL